METAPVKGGIAFGIIDQENHSTIVLKNGGAKNPQTTSLIKAALTVGDSAYVVSHGSFAWQGQIHATAPFSEEHSPRYLNLVAHASDDLGQDIRDFFLQIYRKVNTDRKFEKEIYEDVFRTVHAYEDNPAFRSLYTSVKDLMDIIGRYTVEALYLSITAQPVFEPPENPVGYRSISAAQTDGLSIAKKDISTFFTAHRTLIVEVVIQRQIDDAVFEFK